MALGAAACTGRGPARARVLDSRAPRKGFRSNLQLAGLRASLSDKLLAASPCVSLEAFYGAGGLGDINALVPNIVGEAAKDLVFTPVPPCRIVNTLVAGGII